MEFRNVLLAIAVCMLAYSCAPLRAPIVIKDGSLEEYRYVFISPTTNLTSGSGNVYGGTYGVYGATFSKSINPGDVISGALLKRGYTIVPEIRPDLIEQTLVVNYGESGRRDRGFGYTIEVTIQFISAKTHGRVCLCTAEGQGETEADDIRIAINRCLESLFSE